MYEEFLIDNPITFSKYSSLFFGPKPYEWTFPKNCEIAAVSLLIFFHFESMTTKIEKKVDLGQTK